MPLLIVATLNQWLGESACLVNNWWITNCSCSQTHFQFPLYELNNLCQEQKTKSKGTKGKYQNLIFHASKATSTGSSRSFDTIHSSVLRLFSVKWQNHHCTQVNCCCIKGWSATSMQGWYRRHSIRRDETCFLGFRFILTQSNMYKACSKLKINSKNTINEYSLLDF